MAHSYMAHLTWEQTAGRTVRTARSTRGDTETRAGSNGETGRYYVLASLTPGSTHCTGKSRARGDTGRTKLPNPRPPGAFRRRIGGGWERVHSSWPGGGVPWAAARVG